MKKQHEEAVKNKEIILCEIEIEDRVLKKIYKHHIFLTHYDYFKEAIEEFFDLTEEEQTIINIIGV